MTKMWIEVEQCSYCLQPIMGGTMVSNGNGFDHRECWDEEVEIETRLFRYCWRD